MARVRTRTDTVYPFAELTAAAQAAAIDARREAVGEFFAEDIGQNFDPGWCWGLDAAALGVEFKPRGQRWHNVSTGREGVDQSASVWWALHVQGAGASFDGTWTRPADPIAAMAAHAGDGDKLHAIAAALAETPAGTSARIKADDRYHSLTVDVYDDQGNEADEAIAAIVLQAMREYAEYIYRQIDTEYDYQTSDETIRAYLTDEDDGEYTAEGRRI